MRKQITGMDALRYGFAWIHTFQIRAHQYVQYWLVKWDFVTHSPSLAGEKPSVKNYNHLTFLVRILILIIDGVSHCSLSPDN